MISWDLLVLIKDYVWNRSYVVVDMSQWLSARDSDTTLVLLLEHNVGRLLIDANTKALQFVLDDSLVNQWLVHVKDDENEVASLGYRNNLSTTTLAVFGTFDNTWEIEDLNLGAIVHHLTGDSCEGCELVGRGYRVLEKSFVKEVLTNLLNLADGRETNEATALVSVCNRNPLG